MALNKLSRSRTEQARLVERAQIVLACLSGKRNDEIAAEMKLRPNTVGVWRNREVKGAQLGNTIINLCN